MVVVDQSLWIWHTYFGLLRNNNNLNVLNRSPLVVDMFNNLATKIFFEVNRNLYPIWFEEFKRGAKDMENENFYFQLQNDLVQHLAKHHLIKTSFQLKWFISYKYLLVFMWLLKFPHITVYSHVHSCFFLSIMVLEHPWVPSNLV